MRLVLFFCAASVAAQQTSTYTTDINGRRSAGASQSVTSSNGVTTRTESAQSVNGRNVPLESVEERVVSEDSTGRVIERLVRKFDSNGNPGTSEKQQIQERKNADGSVSSTMDVYRSDLNGRFELAERVRTDASKNGVTATANVTVERKALNGTLDVVEKKVRVESDTPAASKSDVITYRKDGSGRFVEALRVINDTAISNGQRQENRAQYEPGDNGKLRLSSQTVVRARTNADGTESKEIDIFRSVPGRADPAATPQLQERQVIEQHKQGGQLVESTLVLRPTVSDPNRLGPPVKIGERVCTGKGCQ